MSKLVKILLLAIGTPLLLIILALVVGMFFIDAAAKKGIEAGATYALGVNTTLDSASVGIVSGKFGLSGLRVANAPGYPSDKFMSLGDGRVAVSLGSLMNDTIEIPSFSLDTIDMNLEKKEGKANYQVIMDNLAKLSKPGTQPSKPAEGGGKKLVIDELTIRKVKVRADLIGLGAPVTVPIEEIKLHNVGKTGSGVGGSGVTVGQLSSIIVQAVMAAAVENGGGLLPKDILGDLQGGLQQLGGLKDVGVQVVGKAGEAAKDLSKNLQGVAEEGAKELDEAKKQLEGLKGLLPGGDKKK
jgi:hypothetical protein